MAFEPKNFVICSKFPLFRASCNLWLYTTSDSLEDCLAENYFQPRMNTKNQDSPEVGDIIQCIVGGGTLAYLTITAKTEKPYNITVEKTYLENEAEIYETIYLAADKGEQLYQTGVWYAKMYSDTVVPTGSEYEDRNYADFSQVDSDNNPIIIIYEYQSGAWVEIQRITPPTEYNGYLPVTSKFWDIEEQTGQQGGEVLWGFNTKRFTPFPRIISYDSIHVTGDSTVVIPDNPSTTQIVNKDYVDTAIAAIPIPEPTVNINQSIDAEIVGTLTITDNSVVSGFSNNDYLQLPGVFDFGRASNSSFEIGGSFTTSENLGNHIVSGAISIRIYSGNNPKLTVNVNDQTIIGTTALSDSTKYYMKVEYDGTDYKIWLSTDGTNYSLDVSTAATSTLSYNSWVRLGQGAAPTIQSIDLADWYIKKNGIMVWQGMDAPGLHQRAAKGHEVIAFQAPTAGNNYTWYRKYADGWVEQGGKASVTGYGQTSDSTVNLPVTMSDTNFSAQATIQGVGENIGVGQEVTILSTSQISLRFNYSSTLTRIMCWEVKGMAA